MHPHHPALDPAVSKPLPYLVSTAWARPCYCRWKTGRVTKPRFLVQNAEGDIPASLKIPLKQENGYIFLNMGSTLF